MADNFSSLRNRIHEKSHRYFIFQRRFMTQEKTRMFYGATDALLDAATAAASYEAAIGPHTGINILVCYGFLQSLFVQQDAVQILSSSVDLSWKPSENERLKEIRDLRNRLSGHPAQAGKFENLLSSAIIPYALITKSGFTGHIYYEDGAQTVPVDAASVLKENEAILASQLKQIEAKMDDDERAFRDARKQPPLSNSFGTGLDYLIMKLDSDLSDEGSRLLAGAHAQMVTEIMAELQKELERRELDTATLLTLLNQTMHGLKTLRFMTEKDTPADINQHEYNLLCDGTVISIRKLESWMRDLDSSLSASI